MLDNFTNSLHSFKRILKQKGWYLVLIIVIASLDQITKGWAVDGLIYSQAQPFLPFFNFTLLHNTGAAFSFLSDAGGWQRFVLAGISLSISVVLLGWILVLGRHKKMELLAFSLILAGAVGNLWDRLALGYVIDFIDWYYPSADACLPLFYWRPLSSTCHWPAFNIADASICFGVFLLLLDLFRHSDKKASDKKELGEKH